MNDQHNRIPEILRIGTDDADVWYSYPTVLAGWFTLIACHFIALPELFFCTLLIHGIAASMKYPLARQFARLLPLARLLGNDRLLLICTLLTAAYFGFNGSPILALYLVAFLYAGPIVEFPARYLIDEPYFRKFGHPTSFYEAAITGTLDDFRLPSPEEDVCVDPSSEETHTSCN